MTIRNDFELLEAYTLANDQGAFQEIVVRYQNMVMGVARTMVRPDECDDVVQETFLALTKKAAQIRTNLGGWLYRAAHHEALRARDRRSREIVVEDLPDTGGEADEDQVALHDLQAAMQQLSQAEQDLLVKRFCTGLSLIDLAHAEGVNVSSMHARVQKALEKLRRNMRQRESGAAVIALSCLAEVPPSPHVLDQVMRVVLARSAVTSTAIGPSAFTMSTVVVWSILVALLGISLAAFWTIRSSAQAPAAGTVQDQAFTGPVLASLAGEVWIASGGNRRQPATVGGQVAVGAIVETGAGEAELTWPEGGRLTLRESSRLEATGSGLRLAAGAAVVEAATTPRRLLLPRLEATIAQGSARQMSQSAFDRVDTVEGPVQVTSADRTRSLPAGQALAVGDGCPAEPFPAATEELSPRFGGLFFRRVAERYAQGRMMLPEGLGNDLILHQLPITAATAAAAAKAAPGFHVRCVDLNGRPALVIERNDPSLASFLVTYFSENANRYMVTLELNRPDYFFDIGVLPPLVGGERWVPTGLAGLNLPNKKHSFGLRDSGAVTMAVLRVGMLPDGTPVWEKIIRKDGEDWKPPFLVSGPSPTGLNLNLLKPGIEVPINLIRVGFAQDGPAVPAPGPVTR